jgi:YVTN family beta-propeller protein
MFVRSLLVLPALLAITSSSRAAPARPIVVVTAETAGEAIFADPDEGAVIAEVSVAGRPRGLALSRDGRRLFVAVVGPINSRGGAGPAAATGTGAAGLAMIDMATRKLERKVAAGPAPVAVAVSPDGRTAYVVNAGSNELTLVDVASGAVKSSAPTGMAPQGVAIRPDGKIVYVVSHDADEVYALDAKTMKLVIRIEAGPRPQSIVFSRRGDLAFAPDEGFVAVSFLDAKEHDKKETVPVLPSLPKTPQPPVLQMAVPSPDGKRLYVTTGPAGSVAILDIAKKAVVGHIDGVGAFPRGIAMNANGRKLFTANGSSNDVSVIDVASGKVERRIPVPGGPWGIVAAP